jgi:hypothetical protein
MKPLLIGLAIGLLPLAAIAQDTPAKPPVLSGSFTGDLDATAYGGQTIPTVFHAGPPPTLDALNSGTTGIPLKLTVTGDKVVFVVEPVDARFEGVLSADGQSIKGVFSQSGADLPVTYRKKAP